MMGSFGKVESNQLHVMPAALEMQCSTGKNLPAFNAARRRGPERLTGPFYEAMTPAARRSAL